MFSPDHSCYFILMMFCFRYYKDRPRKEDGSLHSNSKVMAFSVQSAGMNGTGNNNELKEINANGLVHNNIGLSGQFNTAYDPRPE